MRFISIILTGFFLSSALSVNAQVDDEGRFVLLQYGLVSEGDCDDVRVSIDNKWNIRRKWVAGCLVTEKLVDSVKVFNAKTELLLAQKYGKDWEERYNKEFSKACEAHLVVLEQSLINSVDRKESDYSERIISNPYVTSLNVHILSNKKAKTNESSISILNLNDDSSNILYRGFPNHFEINLPNKHSKEFMLECDNCSIAISSYGDTLPAKQYFIRPKNGKDAMLNIYSTKKLLVSHSFKTFLLPDPELYINNIQSGSSLPVEALDGPLTIAIRYTDDITLRSEFEVIKWEIQLEGQIIGGEGDKVTNEQLQKLTHLSAGKQLSMICTVKGPDGVLRKKAAAFTLK